MSVLFFFPSFLYTRFFCWNPTIIPFYFTQIFIVPEWPFFTFAVNHFTFTEVIYFPIKITFMRPSSYTPAISEHGPKKLKTKNLKSKMLPLFETRSNAEFFLGRIRIDMEHRKLCILTYLMLCVFGCCSL